MFVDSVKFGVNLYEANENKGRNESREMFLNEDIGGECFFIIVIIIILGMSLVICEFDCL